MAFLMPSAPSASVPYGSLDEPEILLSSDTRSDSSLFNEGQKGESEKARRAHVSGDADGAIGIRGNKCHGHAPE